MRAATHVIKIKAEFDENWNEEKLRELVKTKIKKEIDKFWSPDLELLGIEDNTIEVWIFVECMDENVDIKMHSEKWLKDHITKKEKGITIKNLDVESVRHDNIRITLNDVSADNL